MKWTIDFFCNYMKQKKNLMITPLKIFISNGRSEESYSQTLPEIMNNLPSGGHDSSNFGMDEQQPSNFITSSGDSNGNLGGTSYGYPSSLLQTLFHNTSPPPPAAPSQQPLYDFQSNLDDYNSVSSMPGFSSSVKSKQQALGGLHLANKTPFWNASTLDLNHNRAGFFTSTQSPFLSSTYEEKPIFPNNKVTKKITFFLLAYTHAHIKIRVSSTTSF